MVKSAIGFVTTTPSPVVSPTLIVSSLDFFATIYLMFVSSSSSVGANILL